MKCVWTKCLLKKAQWRDFCCQNFSLRPLSLKLPLCFTVGPTQGPVILGAVVRMKRRVRMVSVYPEITSVTGTTTVPTDRMKPTAVSITVLLALWAGWVRIQYLGDLSTLTKTLQYDWLNVFAAKSQHHISSKYCIRDADQCVISPVISFQ